jgi:hypothetical protein
MSAPDMFALGGRLDGALLDEAEPIVPGNYLIGETEVVINAELIASIKAVAAIIRSIPGFDINKSFLAQHRLPIRRL